MLRGRLFEWQKELGQDCENRVRYGLTMDRWRPVTLNCLVFPREQINALRWKMVLLASVD